MRLGEGQCRNVFRLDKKGCRACAGYNKTCPAYNPAARTYQPTGRRPAASGQADRGQRVRRSKWLRPLWWYQCQRAIYGPRGPVTCCSHPFSDSSRYRYPAAGGG